VSEELGNVLGHHQVNTIAKGKGEHRDGTADRQSYLKNEEVKRTKGKRADEKKIA